MTRRKLLVVLAAVFAAFWFPSVGLTLGPEEAPNVNVGPAEVVNVISSAATSSNIELLPYYQIFPGVACTDSWRTDLYVLINETGSYNYSFWAYFIPASVSDIRYQVQFDLAGASNLNVVTVRDFICAYFPPEVNDSGTLILTSGSSFKAWHSVVYRANEYGISIPPAEKLLPTITYVWFGDNLNDGTYRFNLFVFNNSDEPAMLWVNTDLYAVEPYGSLRVLKIPSVGYLQPVIGDGLYAVVSQVNNETNDSYAVPIVVAPIN